MKTLTHYFSDPVKSSEDSTKIKEVINEPIENNDKIEEIIGKRKRGRVKIKISQTETRGRVCDIVESKNDLIDKTPSPFTSSGERVKKLLSPDATPKRSNVPKNEKSEECNKNNNEEDVDLTYENIFNAKAPKIRQSTPSDSSIDTREESNAFQLLMTRSKPSKYITPKQLSPEEEVLAAQKCRETKSNLQQRKEKIIVLADKKGYAKRKLAEKEEEEKMDRLIENRAKIFKKDPHADSVVIRPEISVQKAPSRGLYNYFSTVTAEEREKARYLELSTHIVEAEIHGETRVLTSKSSVSKTQSQIVRRKTRTVLAAIDDIQVLRSDTSSPTNEEPELHILSSQPERKKRKWTLRINVPTLDQIDDETGGEAMNEDIKSNTNGNEKHRRKGTIKQHEKQQTGVEECTEKAKSTDLVETIEYETKLSSQDNDQNSDIKIIQVKSSKIPSNTKLAPLFIKRAKHDPEVIAARRLFLQSRSSETEKKKAEQKSPVLGTSSLPFPTISHVTQLVSVEESNAQHSEMRYKIKDSPVRNFVLNLDHFKSVLTLKNPTPNSTNILNEPIKPDTEEVLRQIEERCKDAGKMWKVITRITNSSANRVTPKRGRKRKSVDKRLSSSETQTIDTWTQKYKPLTSADVVGNEVAATKLRDWLSTWNSSSSNRDEYSSGEEFCSSDHSRTRYIENNQVAVLLGPHGSGKTASVYAVAEELGFSVLELNASSKRPGKKVLKEFEEATKSHRVKKSHLQLTNNTQKITQNSLILIEDVDLIFDEDEGFVSATYQLASKTKRPIIMTCRYFCPHLNRMAPQQLRIYFQTAAGSRVSAFLELITLAESGTLLPRPCLDKLIMTGDLRRALLQLQYLLASGTPQTVELSENFHQTLWQDMPNLLYKPAIKMNKKCEKKNKPKDSQQNISQVEVSIIDNLANDLDTISLVSILIDIDDSTLNMSQLQVQPSLSLMENIHLYSCNDDRCMEIGNWLRHQVMHKSNSDCDGHDMKNFNQLLLKKELNMGVNFALSQVSTNILDNHIMSTDYLPIIRTICRAEDIKATSNTKRSNRFFHYLQNLRIPSASIKPNILAAACKIMQEKFDKPAEL